MALKFYIDSFGRSLIRRIIGELKKCIFAPSVCLFFGGAAIIEIRLGGTRAKREEKTLVLAVEA